ncbi:hypothetical protein [Actinoplanes sichuanensis]|uniref:Uncharacterized protein n=1 Tax=Actinoplanes sichuanensis TaxID=512349 RepID=A0ABW4AAS6_9ACTN
MNASQIDVQPLLTAAHAHPPLSRAILDGVLMLGRTALFTVVGVGSLIGVAMVIALMLTAAVDIPGYDAAADY